MGFLFNKGAYLRDAWNVLDFVIVGSTFVTLLFVDSSVKLGGIRAIRVLRPLRAVSSIQGLKLLVTALLSSLPLLRDTIIILLFFFLIFAIGGVQLLSGYLKRRCVFIDTGVPHSEDMLCGGTQDCPPGYFCGKRFENPNNGVTNFDNMLFGMLTVFQSVTLEGWSAVMIDSEKVFGKLSIVFFIPLVFIGAFFLLNLTLAVINSKFNEAHKIQIEKTKREKMLKKYRNMKKLHPNEEFYLNDKITIRQFQLAKKVASKMKDMVRNKKKREKLEHHKVTGESQRNENSELPNQTSQRSLEQQLRNSNEQKNKLSLLAKLLNQNKLFEVQKTVKISSIDVDEDNQNKQNNNLGDNFSLLSQSIANRIQKKMSQTVVQEESKQRLSLLGSNLHQLPSNKGSRLASIDEELKNEIIQEEQDEESSNDQIKDLDDSDNSVSLQNYINVNLREQASQIRVFLHTPLARITPPLNNSQVGYRQVLMNGNAGIVTPSLNNPALPTDFGFDKSSDKYNEMERQLDNFISIEDFQPQNNQEQRSTSQNQNERVSAYNLYKINGEDEINIQGLSSQSSLQYFYSLPEDNRTIKKQEISLDLQPESVINSDSEFNTDRFRPQNRQNLQDSPQQPLHLSSLEQKQIVTSIRSSTQQKDYIVLHKPIQDLESIRNNMRCIQIEEKKSSTMSNTNPYMRKQWTINESSPKRTSNLEEILSVSEALTLRRAETKVANQEKKETFALISSHSESKQNLDQDLTLKQEDSNASISEEAKESSRQIENEGPSLYERLFSPTRQKMFLNLSSLHNKISAQMSKMIMKSVVSEKNHKIEIVSGQPYEGTSHKEVFEKRKIFLDSFDSNKYLKLPDKQRINVDPDYETKPFVKSQCEPHQQRVIFEIESEDDLGEEVLIMQEEFDPQPYETLASIGYSHLLSHLPTKQIARRSDIIVTSTLSFTYQPKQLKQEFIRRDQDFSLNIIEPTGFNPIHNIFGPQFFFRSNMDQNSLDVTNESSLQLQNVHHESFSGAASESSQRQSRILKRPHLRQSALKVPEPPRNSWQKQKRSFTIKLKSISDALTNNNYPTSKNVANIKNKQLYKKNKQNIVNKKLTLRDARKIFDGTFYSDDSEDEKKPDEELRERNKHPLLKTIYMKNRHPLFEEHNLLDEFENQAKEQLKKAKETEFNQDNQSPRDEVPSTLRQELSLPDDLKGREVDFYQLRLREAMFKKKNYVWSGKDVLGDQIDSVQSRWVVKQLNDIRVWPKGSHGWVKWARTMIKKTICTYFFENFMIICVLTNTIILAMDRYNISDWEQQLLINLNLMFTVIFMFEMAFKLIAIGLKKYLKDKMNYLDGLIVIFSIIEIIINVNSGNSNKSGLSAFRAVKIFRTFRVLRVARLLRTLHSMQVIVGVITRSITSFIYIALLLLLFIYIYALLGMQIFGGKFNYKDEIPRGNFDTFNTAFVTVFQVLTIENWQQIMFDSMQTELGQILPPLFYVSWIFIGNFILLNLFLAILLDSFIAEEQEKKEEEQQEQQKKLQKDKLKKSKSFQNERSRAEQKKKEREQKKKETRLKRKRSFLQMFNESQVIKNELNENDHDLEDMDEEEILHFIQSEGNHGLTKQGKDKNNLVQLFKDIYCQKSLYLFSRVQVSDGIDIFLTLFFALESFIKAVSMGFVLEEGTYLRESWNVLDFFIVCTSLIDLVMTDIQIDFIKILRLLRTLRPLRFISHNSALKMIVVALLESIGHIINVMIVVMIVWLMFAILGVNIFQGKFFYCSEDKYLYETEAECEKNRGKWLLYDSNFDNVGSAMLTLFVVASLENWPDIMHQAVDATSEDRGPRLNSNPLAAYYFIFFILIGSYFFLNFFIGVLFLKYKEAQKQEDSDYTPEHIAWIDMQKMIISAKPDFETTNVPQSGWRKKIHEFVSSNKFDIGIMIQIVLNMVQMACVYEGASENYLYILDSINIFFTSVFIIEAVLKICAYGNSYFANNWNKFDFAVVIASLIDIIMGQLSESSVRFLRIGPQLARVLRVLRVSRILRLIGKYEGLQALISTITFSLPPLANVIGLLFIIFFMFAVLGVYFFRGVKTGTSVNEYMNFQNFGNAMLMLFRISTGEDWGSIMYDCSKTGDECIENYNCGSKFAIPYFVLFILICTDVMLNLFVLVILQQFDKYYLPQDNIMTLFKRDLQGFKNTWKELTMDKYNCQKIRENQLTQFFQTLKAPLGMPGIEESEIKLNMLKMGIRSDEDGYVYFNELLYRCMRRIYGDLKLSKIMCVQELKTQYKIMQITLQKQRRGRKMKNQEIVKLMIGKANSVNPFLTVMFFKMAFKAWLNHTRQKQMQQERKKALDKGKRDIMQQLDKAMNRQLEQEFEARKNKSFALLPRARVSQDFQLRRLSADFNLKLGPKSRISYDYLPRLDDIRHLSPQEQEKLSQVEFNYYEDEEVLISYSSESSENSNNNSFQEYSLEESQLNKSNNSIGNHSISSAKLAAQLARNKTTNKHQILKKNKSSFLPSKTQPLTKSIFNSNNSETLSLIESGKSNSNKEYALVSGHGGPFSIEVIEEEGDEASIYSLTRRKISGNVKLE